MGARDMEIAGATIGHCVLRAEWRWVHRHANRSTSDVASGVKRISSFPRRDM